jgi:heat shock protein HslJ
MKCAPALFVLALATAACGDATDGPDGPRSVSAIGDAPWRLVSVNGEAVEDERIVLKIAGGFISGQGPCNTINANYIGEAPDFAVETIVTTKMFCEQIGLENRMVEGLLDARRAVVEGGRLTMTGEDSAELVFVPAS